MDRRTRVISSITQARAQLELALTELDGLRALDPALVGVVAHALNNYITVTTATVEILRRTLRGHAERDVHVWLEGIAHAADLMQHSVGRLVSSSAPRDFPLKLDRVRLATLVGRACEYYRRRSTVTGVTIAFEAARRVPAVWGDHVAIAVVVDNLLSNAARLAPRGSTIHVRVTTEPGHVVCRVEDQGPERSEADQAPDDLGLVVADEFIRRMEGQLWSERGDGGSTHFLFRLPSVD
jgi:two-component system sensor histidine kinase GlrK